MARNLTVLAVLAMCGPLTAQVDWSDCCPQDGIRMQYKSVEAGQSCARCLSPLPCRHVTYSPPTADITGPGTGVPPTTYPPVPPVTLPPYGHVNAPGPVQVPPYQPLNVPPLNPANVPSLNVPGNNIITPLNPRVPTGNLVVPQEQVPIPGYPAAEPTPVTTGFRLYDSLELEMPELALSGSGQIPAPLDVTFLFQTPGGGDFEVTELEVENLFGANLGIDLGVATIFGRYQTGKANTGFTAYEPGHWRYVDYYLPPVWEPGRNDAVDVDWNMEMWNVGLQRDFLQGQFAPLGLDTEVSVYAVASYFRALLEPESAVMVSGGTAVSFDPGSTILEGGMFGIGARLRFSLLGGFGLSLIPQFNYFLGDMEGPAFQTMLGATYSF